MRPPLTPSDPSHAEGPWPRVPGYEILGILGRGYVGVVYKARDEQLGRLVAITLPAHGRSEEARALFLHKAQLTARLQHPGIVQPDEVGESEGMPYLVQEFVEGGDLADILWRTGPLPAGQAVELLAEVAEAVAYCHRRGILHRDLKPENILLAPDPDAGEGSLGRPKLTGFQDPPGIAVTVVGTPPYMAPEQWRDEIDQLSPATDVWALGVILYEMVTGQRPFRGEHLTGIFQQITRGDFPPPSTVRPDLPPAIDAICGKCLRTNPRERFASGEELLDALKRAFPAGTEEPFPYETLLGFLRGELDAPGVERVRTRLATDPRWRAHHDSTRHLNLERVAARQDGRDLHKFSRAQATAFCREVARTDGEVLLPLIRKEKEEAAGRARREWDRHIDRCVYCRRMRRLMQARVIREAHGIPADEPLLRDWLLGRHYREPLARLTRRLIEWAEEPPGELTTQMKRDPNRFIERMEPVAGLMLERVVGEADRAGAFLTFLRRSEVKDRLAQAEHVRDVLGGILADFCRQNGLPRGKAARDYLTREVMDNILWQAAAAEQQRSAPAGDQAALEEVRRALREQLRAHREHTSDSTVKQALTRTCPDAQESARLYGRLAHHFEAISR
jgi:hypothetical protein